MKKPLYKRGDFRRELVKANYLEKKGRLAEAGEIYINTSDYTSKSQNIKNFLHGIDLLAEGGRIDEAIEVCKKEIKRYENKTSEPLDFIGHLYYSRRLKKLDEKLLEITKRKTSRGGKERPGLEEKVHDTGKFIGILVVLLITTLLFANKFTGFFVSDLKGTDYTGQILFLMVIGLGFLYFKRIKPKK